MLASRPLFRDTLRARLSVRFAGVEQHLQSDGAYRLFSLRLIPVAGYFLLNVPAGLAPIRVGTHGWGQPARHAASHPGVRGYRYPTG